MKCNTLNFTTGEEYFFNPNHRMTELQGLKWTSRNHCVQPPCYSRYPTAGAQIWAHQSHISCSKLPKKQESRHCFQKCPPVNWQEFHCCSGNSDTEYFWTGASWRKRVVVEHPDRGVSSLMSFGLSNTSTLREAESALFSPEPIMCTQVKVSGLLQGLNMCCWPK